MKTIALFIALLATSYCAKAQNPGLDQLFQGFQGFFETSPMPNLQSQVSVRYTPCTRPYREESTAFPTETQLIGSDITVTYAFFILNAPTCLIGYVERYPIPILQQGAYRVTVNARLVSLGLPGAPPRIVETRTISQINFQVGEPLVTQVPSLTPAAFALLSLMMLGVGAYMTGRRHS